MRNELENALGARGLRGLQAAGWMVVIAISFVLIRAGKDLFIPLVIALIGAVSYTHLTLPTIYSV